MNQLSTLVEVSSVGATIFGGLIDIDRTKSSKVQYAEVTEN